MMREKLKAVAAPLLKLIASPFYTSMLPHDARAALADLAGALPQLGERLDLVADLEARVQQLEKAVNNGKG